MDFVWPHIDMLTASCLCKLWLYIDTLTLLWLFLWKGIVRWIFFILDVWKNNLSLTFIEFQQAPSLLFALGLVFIALYGNQHWVISTIFIYHFDDLVVLLYVWLDCVVPKSSLISSTNWRKINLFAVDNLMLSSIRE